MGPDVEFVDRGYGMNDFERGRLNEANLSYEEVARLLEYDELTGLLYWRVNKGTARAGAVAGCVRSDAYRRVRINGVEFKAHRIIWLLVHRRWPADQLDHIDGNQTNNRIANLREVSSTENGRNQKLPRNNTSRVVGVTWYKPLAKWVAYITVNGRTIHLGYYRYKTSAIVARRKAERKYRFHTNHGRRLAA
jgi:hypothetical protein